MPFEFHPTLNMTPIEMIFRHVLFYADHGELNRTVWVEKRWVPSSRTRSIDIEILGRTQLGNEDPL